MAKMSKRDRLLTRHVLARGIRDPLVIAALKKVPREAFVPKRERRHAFEDRPLPIGGGQTISQPYIVAFMVEALELRGGEKVLEIGAGSGYAAAVLAEIAGAVYAATSASASWPRKRLTICRTPAMATCMSGTQTEPKAGPRPHRSTPFWCRQTLLPSPQISKASSESVAAWSSRLTLRRSPGPAPRSPHQRERVRRRDHRRGPLRAADRQVRLEGELTRNKLALLRADG